MRKSQVQDFRNPVKRCLVSFFNLLESLFGTLVAKAVHHGFCYVATTQPN